MQCELAVQPVYLSLHLAWTCFLQHNNRSYVQHLCDLATEHHSADEHIWMATKKLRSAWKKIRGIFSKKKPQQQQQQQQ